MADASLTRRTFLTVSGVALAAGTLAACGAAGGAVPLGETLGELPAGDAPAAPGVSEGLELAPQADGTLWHLTRTDFEGWTGESFEMRPEGRESVVVDLVQVEDRSGAMTPEQRELGLREPFSVRFHAPLGTAEREGAYTLAHPAMGAVLVHVSDGGTTEDGDGLYVGPPAKVYELHFN